METWTLEPAVLFLVVSCEPNPALSDAEVPNRVRIIEREAFLGCSALRTVTIPLAVWKIEADAFAGCPALETAPGMPREAVEKCDGIVPPGDLKVRVSELRIQLSGFLQEHRVRR